MEVLLSFGSLTYAGDVIALSGVIYFVMGKVIFIFKNLICQKREIS